MKHVVRIEGLRAADGRVGGALLRGLLDVLIEGSRRTLRQRVEGRSTATGPTPVWIEQAADFEVVALRSGSAVLEIEAPSLSAVAAARFQQADFFLDIDPASSALGFFEQTIEEALAGQESSDALDLGILEVQSRFAGIFDLGVSELTMSSNDEPRQPRIVLHRESLERVTALERKTPKARAVRVTGKLNEIEHSRRLFKLVLPNGSRLRGVASELAAEELSARWGKDVSIQGRAFFRPDGNVQRIEAEHIENAGPGSELFVDAPRPLTLVREERVARVPQSSKSGINAFIGCWPGEESDSEVEALLAELS